jgi:NAD(P)-dependent dehydrogenase (short-subunit alcohol dehydrogenase family)
MAGWTVLVTGGSSGIGKATALGLARMGAHLAIIGRDQGRTEASAAEIRAEGGGQVDVFLADLSSQSEVRRLADEVLHSMPRLDVLVNNVGGYWNGWHVTADGLERVTGCHFADNKPKRSSERSYDQAAATRLWNASADLVGLTAATSTRKR